MLGRMSSVGLVAVVVALGLVSPAKASGIKGGYRLVDLRASDDRSQPYLIHQRIDDAGNIGHSSRPGSGDYTFGAVTEPGEHGEGRTVLNYVHRAGSDENLLTGTLSRGDLQYYIGVNSLGHVVGDSNRVEGRSFVFDAVTGELVTVKFLPGAGQRPQVLGINNLDQMVGTQDGKAIFYESPTATPIELADLPGADTGWTFYSASGINNKGEIVGNGTGPDGNNGTFKLEPVTVPEPSSLLIFAALGLVAWRAASRRGRAGGRS